MSPSPSPKKSSSQPKLARSTKHPLHSKALELSLSPGVYIFKDAEGTPLYVGKAKQLKTRVLSYFRNASALSPRISKMIQKAVFLEHQELKNEQEALVRENELIKKWQPHYNVLLRDDKTYPWVKVTIQDQYPRIFLTRKLKEDGSVYYGPFPNAGEARSMIEYIVKSYKIRDCRDDIRWGVQTKPCLSLQIGLCDGPCQDLITPQHYRQIVQKACAFLDGHQREIVLRLRQEMQQAAQSLNFEKAAQKRDLIQTADIMRKGRYLRRQRDLSQTLFQLQNALHLEAQPNWMECFDISNIQGSEPVASLVVFIDGKPARKEYRRFKIKTVDGINDFAMMKEVVRRRYARRSKEKKRLPDLIVIDGGKGQLKAACEALEELSLDLDIVSLAKRFEFLFLPHRPEPVMFPKHSDELQLMQRLRDEAHRFAVSFHRTLRSQRTLSSSFEKIPGIGPKKAQMLLKKGLTLEQLSQLTSEDLQNHYGLSASLVQLIEDAKNQLF